VDGVQKAAGERVKGCHRRAASLVARAAALLGARSSCFASTHIGSWSGRSGGSTLVPREANLSSARGFGSCPGRPTTISLLRRETTVVLSYPAGTLPAVCGRWACIAQVDLPSVPRGANLSSARGHPAGVVCMKKVSVSEQVNIIG